MSPLRLQTAAVAVVSVLLAGLGLVHARGAEPPQPLPLYDAVGVAVLDGQHAIDVAHRHRERIASAWDAHADAVAQERAAAAARKAEEERQARAAQARAAGTVRAASAGRAAVAGAPAPIMGSGSCGGDLPPCSVLRRESGGIINVWHGHCYYPVGWTGGNSCGKRTTASGKWQFVRGTWAKFMGYLNAADAPEWVQDEKARQVYANGAGGFHWGV